jgi:hypothetical protein
LLKWKIQLAICNSTQLITSQESYDNASFAVAKQMAGIPTKEK